MVALFLTTPMIVSGNWGAPESDLRMTQLSAETPPPQDYEEPKKITFKPGTVVCAKTNVIAGLTTAFSFPVDFRRGSCWRYEGRSGTGKVELALIDEKLSVLPLDPNTVAYFHEHPVKIQKDLFVENFVSEEESASVRDAQVALFMEKWPGLSKEQALKIYQGEPFLDMTTDQAAEAVGWLVHRRSKRVTKEGQEEMWEIGKRSLAAQTTSEIKGSMITDLLVGPGYRLAPPSPTLAAAAEETIGQVLTFIGGKLVAIEDVSHPR
jgi:hypothetical protein